MNMEEDDAKGSLVSISNANLHNQSKILDRGFFHFATSRINVSLLSSSPLLCLYKIHLYLV